MFTARRRSVPCWQRGRSSGRRTGSSGSIGSIGPTTRESWSRSAKACTEGALWSAGAAMANLETIGPRVGLSSKWSAAEDGPFRMRSVIRLESPPRDLPHKIYPTSWPFGCCIASGLGLRCCRCCWEPRNNPFYRYRTCPAFLPPIRDWYESGKSNRRDQTFNLPYPSNLVF